MRRGLIRIAGLGCSAIDNGMDRRLAQFLSRLLAVICTVAVVAVSMAHRPLSATAVAPDPQLLAFLAAGGSVDDLCHADHSGTPGHATGDCPACTLSKSFAAPPAAPGLPALIRSARTVQAPVASLCAAGAIIGLPPARGPPVLQI
ncbi:MAG: hypothetical protein KF887_12985 [Paracoccaceae bacterium]|nr:MAG: hypothetical protein KF887_12985 [Paracoccaceae bacterium]